MKIISDVKLKVANDEGFNSWDELMIAYKDNLKRLDFLIDRVAYCYIGEETPTHNNHNLIPHTFPFRLGRKQQIAVLDVNGLEVVIFPKGKEEMARITTMMWNDWHKELCKACDVQCYCSYCYPIQLF